MIDQGIVSLLAADTGIAAILATGGAGSIFQTETPEDLAQYPCIGYQLVGGNSDSTLSTSGMQKARLQIDCWALTGDVAKNLAAAVIAALNCYQGQLSDGTRLLDAQLVHPGADVFGSGSRYFCRMLEFYLFFNFTS